MEFLRYCEVTIGPLADWQGKGNTGEAVVIRADGTAGRLRIAFSASKSLTGDPNKTELTIYGLGRDLRRAMRTELTRVQIIAGYESSGRSAAVVAVGAISAAISTRQGADITTKLTILDGFGGMVRGAISRSYKGGTPIAQAVKEAAQSMPGVTVGEVSIVGRLPAKGVQLSGPATAQLNKLADQFGFSWSVQNGIFQAVPDDGDTGEEFSFTSDRNLVSLSPSVSGPSPGQGGVEIVGKFDARIKPGDRVAVQSDINPQLSGTYKVTSVTANFDSHGPASVQVQAQSIT